MTHLTVPWLDFNAWRALRGSYLFNLANEGARYLVVGLLMWLLLHVILRRRLTHRLIAAWPSARDMCREFAYSVSTLLIFAALGMAVFALIITGHATIYRDPARYGVWWFWLRLPAMLLWHDLYFYWTHRLLHTRWLFRRMHGVHHRSRHPSPWAAYAFHPLEALINGLVTPLALLVIPLHGGVLLVFGLHQIVRNTHGHAAVETMPRGFVRHWLWGRFTTTTHHHLHHETAKGNYGLWFTWWGPLVRHRARGLRRSLRCRRWRPSADGDVYMRGRCNSLALLLICRCIGRCRSQRLTVVAPPAHPVAGGQTR